MEFEIYGYTLWEIVPAAVLLIAFIIQMIWYPGRYGKVAVFKQRVSRDTPAVSVVVVLEDNMAFVEQTLPLLLEQDYRDYEVVVVDYGCSPEVAEALEGTAMRYAHLKTTRINVDTKYKRRRKLALSVGIKAASFPHILFTESYAYPPSSQWLPTMAKGFTAAQVVIGYANYEPAKGFFNKLIRCSRLMMSVRYLSSAIRGRVYRGISTNLGFTAPLYFEHKGYNYQRLNTGDNDLFIQKIATLRNTAVILSPQSAVREHYFGGLAGWWSERRYHSHTYRYYPASVRAGIFTELFSRVLFFAAAAWLIARMVPVLWIAAVVILVLRWLAVYYVIFRICLRLGEKNLLFAFFLHDLVSPFSETLLSLSRKIRPSQGVWS
ncbi:MAG: hypothetical protein LUD68_10335 [Rikenellaceae bacterium]|nr:hypothetical protein [Rikenellaceae bacterium]